MLKKKTILCLVASSMALASTRLFAAGQMVEPPHPNDTQAAATAARVHPNVSGIKVQDVDQPARAPFQVTVPVNVNNFNYTPVTIPTGQRLVIDFVSVTGAAASSAGAVQPIAILSASTAGNPNALYYMAPTPSTTLPTQFYHSENTAIYADTLAVGPAYAGYTPDYMVMSVVISGHLISNP